MPPVISEQPSFKHRSVLIAWDKPPKTGKELDEMDDITSFRCTKLSVLSVNCTVIEVCKNLQEEVVYPHARG